MPTFVIIEFIHDVLESETINKRGKTTLIWKARHSAGDKLRLKYTTAHSYVKNGYAKYVN